MLLNNNINREIMKPLEIMEIDDSMTYSYVRLANGEILEREQDGRFYKSIKTKDTYIPVVVWKEDKQKSAKGFINVSEQDDSYNDFYSCGQDENAGGKRPWKLFGFKKR